MDDETFKRLHIAAEQAGPSTSAWLAALVRERSRSEWPPEVVALAGVWADFPTAEELRSSSVEDAPRKAL